MQRRVIAICLSLLVILFTVGSAVAVQSWFRGRLVLAEARYAWERGRCYRTEVRRGGSVTKAQVQMPDEMCPPVDWQHPPPGMSWRAIADCSFAGCAQRSILAKSPLTHTSFIGGGPTKEEACLNAQSQLREFIINNYCQPADCRCVKADAQSPTP